MEPSMDGGSRVFLGAVTTPTRRPDGGHMQGHMHSPSELLLAKRPRTDLELRMCIEFEVNLWALLKLSTVYFGRFHFADGPMRHLH